MAPTVGCVLDLAFRKGEDTRTPKSHAFIICKNISTWQENLGNTRFKRTNEPLICLFEGTNKAN